MFITASRRKVVLRVFFYVTVCSLFLLSRNAWCAIDSNTNIVQCYRFAITKFAYTFGDVYIPSSWKAVFHVIEINGVSCLRKISLAWDKKVNLPLSLSNFVGLRAWYQCQWSSDWHNYPSGHVDPFQYIKTLVCLTVKLDQIDSNPNYPCLSHDTRRFVVAL